MEGRKAMRKLSRSREMWDTDPSLDISKKEQLVWAYRWDDCPQVKLKPIRKFGLLVFPFNKELVRVFPCLKEYVSPWHLIFRDVYLIPCNERSAVMVEENFGKRLGAKLKGALFFGNASFILVYDK